MSRAAAWTPEKRAAHSERMRLIMSSPAMRAKVSERTKEGMKNQSAPGLQMLRLAWAAAQPATRKRFFEEITLPVCTASASSEPGGADEQRN